MLANESTIITKDEIESLLNKYNVNQTTLSQLLGWGQNTIARYLSEKSTPTPQYSNTLKNLYDPIQMRELLRSNGSVISPSTVDKINSKITDLQFEIIKKEFPGQVFIKKINPNELGYRKNISKKAGAFLLVTKSTIDFFPPLSRHIYNDKAYLKMKFPELDTEVEITYEYHNNKYTHQDPKKNRDEHRLYLSHLDKFAPNDIVVFIKSAAPNHYTVYKISENNQNTYPYMVLSSLIDDYKYGKSSAALVPIAALVASRIKIAELYLTNVTSEDIEELLKEPILLTNSNSDESKTVVSDVSDLLDKNVFTSNLDLFVGTVTKVKRKAIFRKAVLSAYDNKCCITNVSICYNNQTNLQAAHIIPKYCNGSDNPTNGLALSHDLHWAYDNGYFTILDDYTIEVHEKVLDNPVLKPLHHKKIYLPKDKEFYPSLVALDYHRKNIYGNFLNGQYYE